MIDQEKAAGVLDTQEKAAPSLDTSAQSLAQMGLKQLARQQQEIYDIVRGAMRNGARDMSGSEIQGAYERCYGRRIDRGRIAARVSDMVTAGRLCRREDTRPCSVTGRNIHAVYVPERQARFFT